MAESIDPHGGLLPVAAADVSPVLDRSMLHKRTHEIIVALFINVSKHLECKCFGIHRPESHLVFGNGFVQEASYMR